VIYKLIRNYLTALISFVLILSLTAPAIATTAQQERIHNDADILRGLGFADDSEPITALTAAWWGEENNAEMLTTLVYNEAGCCTNEHMEWVAQTALNRVADERFPNTLYDVLVQRGQYHPDYANFASRLWAKARVDEALYLRCRTAAEKALNGETFCPTNVVWQANFKQGKGVEKAFYSEVCRNYTYFCY
jgi:hypothetical protein